MAALEERPIELSDGRVLMPDDVIPVADLWEVLPLMLEKLGAAPADGLAPGQQLPVAGMPPPQGAPGTFQRPGAIPGTGGVSGGPGGFGAGGRGTGFSGIGGGGKGARGQQGPAGPQGPPGPGTILPAVKTDGNFTVSSTSPFVVVPGTTLSFVQASEGPVVFLVQAVFGGNSVDNRASGQLGLRIDGVDQPLTASLMASDSGQFLAGVHGSFPKTLAEGSHSVEVVLRGDSSLGAPTGNPVTVQASALSPLALTVIHR